MNSILREVGNTDWITIVILISIVFVIVAKSMFYSRFLNFMVLPFNNKYLFIYNKKDILLNWFHIFISAFQIMNLTLFIFYTTNILFSAELAATPINYLIIFGLLVLFFVLKIFIQLGNSFVFDNQKTITEIIFKKISFMNFSGLILFLANILLTFILPGSKWIVLGGILLVFVINLVGWITILKNHQKYISSNFFYFILYLCALEISPYALIVYYVKA
ncbi:MAG: DUF4271 domain-containing protein [Bacteroidia bacterium]|nr:DUF4271 domain-containing protein [Bacteroidia bacterium]